MMKLPLLSVAALLAAAVSAPAQVTIEARLGRMFRGGIAHLGHHHQCQPVQPRRVSGRWETVREQVLVPGYWQEQHTPPTYGWIVDPCGRRRWGIVAEGGCTRVWVPARWETRCRQVWVAC